MRKKTNILYISSLLLLCAMVSCKNGSQGNTKPATGGGSPNASSAPNGKNTPNGTSTNPPSSTPSDTASQSTNDKESINHKFSINETKSSIKKRGADKAMFRLRGFWELIKKDGEFKVGPNNSRIIELYAIQEGLDKSDKSPAELAEDSRQHSIDKIVPVDNDTFKAYLNVGLPKVDLGKTELKGKSAGCDAINPTEKTPADVRDDKYVRGSIIVTIKLGAAPQRETYTGDFKNNADDKEQSIQFPHCELLALAIEGHVEGTWDKGGVTQEVPPSSDNEGTEKPLPQAATTLREFNTQEEKTAFLADISPDSKKVYYCVDKNNHLADYGIVGKLTLFGAKSSIEELFLLTEYGRKLVGEMKSKNLDDPAILSELDKIAEEQKILKKKKNLDESKDIGGRLADQVGLLTQEKCDTNGTCNNLNTDKIESHLFEKIQDDNKKMTYNDGTETRRILYDDTFASIYIYPITMTLEQSKPLLFLIDNRIPALKTRLYVKLLQNADRAKIQLIIDRKQLGQPDWRNSRTIPPDKLLRGDILCKSAASANV